jgi:hypothetical protein
MRNHAFAVIVVIILTTFILPQELAAQCAMCKQSAESSLKSNPGSIARGLNSGILYLMAVPYLAIMFIFRKQLLTLARRIMAKWQQKAA